MVIQQVSPGSGFNTRLDVGGDTGALILFTSPTLIASRIHLIPENKIEPRGLGTVRERDLPQGVAYAAVYPHLRCGVYSIEDSGQKVTIARGRVTTLDFYEDCCRIYYHPATLSVLTRGG